MLCPPHRRPFGSRYYLFRSDYYDCSPIIGSAYIRFVWFQTLGTRFTSAARARRWREGSKPSLSYFHDAGSTDEIEQQSGICPRDVGRDLSLHLRKTPGHSQILYPRSYPSLLGAIFGDHPYSILTAQWLQSSRSSLCDA